MGEAEEPKKRLYNILVYGCDKLGLNVPSEPLRKRNYCLYFEPYSTHRRFNEFDGVILYQGVFEHFAWKPGFDGNYLVHSCDKNELDKRKKEVDLLLADGGFLCFLLRDPFIDRHERQQFLGTDLAKYCLNYPRLHRENYSERVTQLEVKFDEFRKYLNHYGAASSHFTNYGQIEEWRVIAEVAGHAVGMIIDRVMYFVPTLVPENRAEVLEEYFTLLAEALTSTHNKLSVELPDWIGGFKFGEEDLLKAECVKLEARIGEINDRKRQLDTYKSILVLSGDDLVDGVIRVFEDGLRITVDPKDENREDFKLLDDKGQSICLCEVKGTNKGVNREYINQADSHRERAGVDGRFPSLLIANTNIKHARSIVEKDQEIAQEQIRHAVKMNVLVLRTLDLLGLLRLYLAGRIGPDEIKRLLSGKCGWLRVSEEGCELVTGENEERV